MTQQISAIDSSLIYTAWHFIMYSACKTVIKNLPANARDARDPGSIPGSERSPGGRHDNPLQYSYLENPMDGGVWWATVQSRVAIYCFDIPHLQL